MRITKFFAIILLLAFASACKPTEKGYKSAYEAAKGKRQQTDPDQDLLTGGHKLLNDVSTRWVVADGDSLELQHVYLKPAEGSQWPQPGPYRLAVAMFKMSTNANSLLSDLTGKGTLKPVIASDLNGRHFVIAGSATYPDSISQVLKTFKKEHPQFRYIGLTPERPMVIVSR